MLCTQIAWSSSICFWQPCSMV